MSDRDDYAFRWGVEDRQFGRSPFDPTAPIVPSVRERYMKGYDSEAGRIAANRAMVQRERDRIAKSQAQWRAKLSGEPAKPAPRKRGKHEHGKDW